MFAFSITAIGGFVGIRATNGTEIISRWVGPESWVYDFDVFFGDGLWVVAVFFVKAFFECVVHGIDGNFAVFVALHGIEIGFLNKKDN